MRRVVVVEYDLNWPNVFILLRDRIWPVVNDFAVGIEHIGSTSVPGLAAKPIIDMTVVIPSAEHVPLAVDRLASLGYAHRGDLGIAGREAFRSPEGQPLHHLYVCLSSSLGLLNPIALRDYLRTQPEAAKAYGDLKKSLASEFPNDMDSYLDGKTEMILGILKGLGFSSDQLETIAGANRKPGR